MRRRLVNKDVQDLIKQAEKFGFQVDLEASCIKIRPGNGRLITAHYTSSDWRAYKNILSLMRREARLMGRWSA